MSISIRTVFYGGVSSAILSNEPIGTKLQGSALQRNPQAYCISVEMLVRIFRLKSIQIFVVVLRSLLIWSIGAKNYSNSSLHTIHHCVEFHYNILKLPRTLRNRSNLNEEFAKNPKPFRPHFSYYNVLIC